MAPKTASNESTGTSNNVTSFLTGDILTIEVGNDRIQIHRRLLEHKAPFFKDDKGLRAFQTAAQKIFAKLDKAILANFVDWLYTGKYTTFSHFAHLELYAFASKHDIQDLQSRVVKAFRRGLKHAELTGEDFVELIDRIAGEQGKLDALAEVIMEVAAGKVNGLMESQEFREFVGHGGPVVVNLMEELGRRTADV